MTPYIGAVAQTGLEVFSTSSSSQVVIGLTNGQTYTFRVAAMNAVVWLVAARATGKASIGSLATVAVLLIGVAVTGRPGWELAATIGVGAVVVLRHTSNLRALARGEERSLR